MLDKIYVSMGDFLKNAGIVGLKYLLDESEAEEQIDYGITDDAQAIWMDRGFAETADWTDMYFKAFVKCYGSETVYHAALDKITSILEKSEQSDWEQSSCKDDLKFINDKLLSNSYKSGFENIKDKIDNPQVYELLKASKLKESMEQEELRGRLKELKTFLEQPLCEETFSMKSIIYNYINRFWDGKSFLLRANAAKDMKTVFDADFSEPFRQYVIADHVKAKDMCIDCSGLIDSKEKVSIAFMKEQADDLARKKSAFWDCKVDAYLCPLCAFVYALSPLGFQLIGDKFLFININVNIDALLGANKKIGKVANDAKKQEDEKFSSWIARALDVLLKEKSRELGNIQVIARGKGDSDRYTFDVISKDVLKLLNDEKVQRYLRKLSEHPFIKNRNDFMNIHETVVMNILQYRNQYALINMLLKLAIDNNSMVYTAATVYDIQFRVNMIQKDMMSEKTGGGKMDLNYVKKDGYKLRKELLSAKGATDDACIRGTVYKLVNALAVCDVARFMDIIMRIYCSTKLCVPNAFIKLLEDKESFQQYGYAFLIGLQGGYYEKEEKVND